MQQTVAPHPSLDVLKTATDSLALPLRRPILFVPFLFALALLSVLIGSLFGGILNTAGGASRITPQLIIDMGVTVAMAILIIIFAVETIVVLTVRAELGRDLDLVEAVWHALSRFPVTLATTVVMTAGIVVGMMLLIIPGLVVAARWFLAPNAVLVGGRGMREAIGVSWRMTGAHFAPLLGLSLLVGVGTAILKLPLSFFPVVGPLAAAWLGLAWGGIALALAYVRLGGPVDLG